MTAVELIASELDAYAEQSGRPELLRSAAIQLRMLRHTDLARENEKLRGVATAANDLCENIRERGVHDNWKTLANALRAV